MSNRLSFTQILQKKQSNLSQSQLSSSNISSSRISNFPPSSQLNPTSYPSLSEFMQEFEAYPHEEYVLNFSPEAMNDGDDFYEEDNDYDEEEFTSGVNPLDSWVMNQSKIKGINNRNSGLKSNNNRQQNFHAQRAHNMAKK